MCPLHAHYDCTHRFAKRDSGDDGADVWDHNACTGQDKCFLVALQNELCRGLRDYRLSARGDEVFSWRGSRRARGWLGMPRFPLCRISALDCGKWVPTLCKSNPNLLRIRSSIQMQLTKPPKSNANAFRPIVQTYICNSRLSQFRSKVHTNATNTTRPRKCNLILCKVRPNYIQMQPKLAPNSVIIPSSCNPKGPNFVPTLAVERHTKNVGGCRHIEGMCGRVPHKEGQQGVCLE